MKIFLASFMQPENFGTSGEIISITSTSKPRTIKVSSIYKPFTPSNEMLDKYHELRETNPSGAGTFFTCSYLNQLQEFVDAVNEAAKEENKTPIELLPFNDGDTLCSWERAQYTNYRKILAPFLEKLGYEVVLK